MGEPGQGGLRGLAHSGLAAARWLVALVLVAVGASAFAIAFRISLSSFFQAMYGQPDVVSAMRGLPVGVRIVAPAIGGLLAGLLARAAARKGPPAGMGEVMEAVAFGRVKLSMLGTLLRSAGTWLTLAGGASVGREGPTVQVGATIMQALGQALRLPRVETQRGLVLAGGAAGVAAAFNTPLAGIVFAIEELGDVAAH